MRNFAMGSTMCGLVSPLMLCVVTAHAQEAVAAGAAGAADTADAGLGDIVVTAQRRAESLQKVPIAIAAIDATGLERAGITDTNALSAVTPGLQLNLTRNTLTTYLRGVGTQNAAVGEEGSIAAYVDGVYVAALSGATLAFNNIERVEVLKGPQGTLFGRNATGGLIHVITRDPSFDPAVQGTVGYANYDSWTATGYASAGLTDTIAFDVAGYFTDQGKGWGHNVSGIQGLDGTEVNYRDEWAVRSKLLITPTDALKIVLSGDYSKRESDIGNTRQIYPGAVANGGTRFTGGIYDSPSGLPRDVKSTAWGVGLKIDYDLGGPSLTSTTAYRNYYDFGLFDQDAAPLNLLAASLTNRTKTFQQEMLLIGDQGSIDYTLGLFYFWSRAQVDPLGLRSGLLAGQRLDRFSTQITHSYAAFAQATWHLSEQTGLTAGLRFTRDEREIDGQDLSAAGYVGPIIGSPVALPRPVGSVIRSTASDPDLDKRHFDKLTWRLALDHQFTDRVLGYASYSRGFKSGVFNSSAPYDAAVRPETLDAYEVGLKSDLLGRQLRVNASAFYYDYKDIQLSSIIAGVTALYNAAKGRVKGAEIELIAAPPVARGSLEFRASASYLDGVYTSFPAADLTQRAPVTPLPVGGVCVGGIAPQPAGPPTGGNTHCSGDASGNKMIRTPPITLNLSADYHMPIGDAGDLGFNLSYYFNGGFYFEPDNRIKQENYNLLNAQISFTAPDDRWSVTGFVRNLTQQKYLASFTQGIGDVASYGAPRTYGVTLGFKFKP